MDSFASYNTLLNSESVHASLHFPSPADCSYVVCDLSDCSYVVCDLSDCSYVVCDLSSFDIALQ